MTDERYYPLSRGVAAELLGLDPPLTKSEWKLWIYLVSRSPFGNSYEELPELVDVLASTRLSKTSFYRALARLEEAQLIDAQWHHISIRNLRGSGRKNSGESIVPKLGLNSQNWDKIPRIGTGVPELGQSCGESKKENGFAQGFEEFSTETGNVPKNKTNTLKETNIGTRHGKKGQGGALIRPSEGSDPPESEPRSEQFQSIREDPGGDASASLERLCTNAGIQTNKTIRGSLCTLERAVGSAAAAAAVRNAISALEEQRKVGQVRNPCGFFISALRRGYTSNQAKKRQQKGEVQPPDLNQVEAAVDQAIFGGDRPFAQARLQQVWADGWSDPLTDLLMLRRDWRFTLTEQGVKDADG